jgi:hypothetical protein
LAPILLGCLSSAPAAAITAGDVLDKMDGQERVSFLAGAVDMASFLFALAGNHAKADCAVDWHFHQEGSLEEIRDVFSAHKDLDAVGVLSVLIDRHCGK